MVQGVPRQAKEGQSHAYDQNPDHMFIVDTGDGSRQNLMNWQVDLVI